MTWTEADIPDLSGRVAVVTGGNGGLGLASVQALAGAGAHVVIAARNQDKAADAVRVVHALHPGASVEVVPLDLGSLASVAEAGAAIVEAHPKLDILLCNAGVMAPSKQTTVDGFEFQIGVNHLGHWALTSHVLPALLEADAARVVTVTSVAHHIGRRLSSDLVRLRGRYEPWTAYGATKLANWHFAFGLEDRFRAAGVRAIALSAHPGLTNSELQATSVEASGGGITQRFFHVLTETSGMSTEHGARPQLRAATDPAARGRQFYGPRFGTHGRAVRLPVVRRWDMDRSIEVLWRVSEAETGLAVDPAAVPGRAH